MVKHPSDGSKNGDVGHAWIYLQGMVDGKQVVVEGGHSGELGIIQAKYLDGVMNYIECGYANPQSQKVLVPRYEPDPIKYLWADQCDGFFQKRSGGHIPTFAAKINLTEDQFHRVLAFIDPANYFYCHYAITRNQCSSFLAQVAAIVDFSLECELSMQINQCISVGGRDLILWENHVYSSITFSSPDVIEKCLMQRVEEGSAENALSWYLKHRGRSFCEQMSHTWHDMHCLPARTMRWLGIIYTDF